MKTFLISDMHFGHDGMYKFTNHQGKLVRPWAPTALAGDRIMVWGWNAVVKPEDKVYVVGDVAIPRRGLKTLELLNGRKILVAGNHDVFKLKDYLPHFEDIKGVVKLDDFFLTHIPMHPESIPRWCKANIHGHLHGNRVMKKNWYGKKVIDKRYFNVSVECIDLVPIDFEVIKEMYK